MTTERFYEFGDFRVDIAARRLYRSNGEVVRVTPRLFDTLLYLIEHRDRLIEKDELIAAIWPNRIVEENNLNQTISALRRALGNRDGQCILTVPGRGFRFVDLPQNLAEIGPGPLKAAADRRGNVVQLYALAHKVEEPARHPSPAEGRAAERQLGSIASLAVLPFKPLIAGQSDDGLLLGMAELLIARLSASRELVVRPLGVVRRYGTAEQDPLEAGRELGVDAVLDGGVLRTGERVRVTGRLLRIADGVALWAGSFDERFADVFALQDAITERVAQALALPLAGATLSHLTRRQTESVDAYQLYLAGRQHSSQLTQNELRTAIALFERAIALDPRYARAHAGAADAYRRLPVACDLPPEENFPYAEAAAQKALALDPNQADAHVALGFVRFWYDWRWDEAKREFLRAIEIDPDSAESHLGYAHLLSNIGQHERAIAEIRRARELDPLSLIANTLEASFLALANRYDEAVTRLQRIFDINPNFWIARMIAGTIHMKSGQSSRAIADFRAAVEHSGPAPHAVSFLACGQAGVGDREGATATLRELETMALRRHVPPSNFAAVHCALGATSLALDWLERAHQARDLRLSFLRVDWRWQPIRRQPRFVRLLRQMDLMDAE
jgi:DNA-binding winged helix-turn-helix (wHTH) protein/TolB-like protein/tetratricopeptide (TPR) repeat protein